jgi:hypothetical protein
LIYGEKIAESQSLCILASLLHEPNEFNNIFQHISPYPLTPSGTEDDRQELEQSMQVIYQRSGLKRSSLPISPVDSKKVRCAPKQEEWEYVQALDKLREENSKTFPERQIVKSKPTRQKKVTMIAAPTAVIGDKHGSTSRVSSREGTMEPEEAPSTRSKENRRIPSKARATSPPSATPVPDTKMTSSTSLQTTEVLNTLLAFQSPTLFLIVIFCLHYFWS